MRITHVIDYFHTDVRYQEYYLAREQSRQTHVVSVVTSERRQHTVAEAIDDGGGGARDLADLGVVVRRLPSWQLGHDRAHLRGLEGALADTRPDVLHVHGPFAPTSFRAVRWAERTGTPVLVDNHIQDAIAPGAGSAPARAAYRVYAATAGRTMRRAVGDWVTNGPYETEFLNGRLRVPRSDITEIPLGFDPEMVAPDEGTRIETRTRLGVADGELLVAATGKLHAAKRVDLTAAACERHGREGDIHLILAGVVSEETRSAVAEAAPALTRAGKVAELGMLNADDLGNLYRAADVVVFARLPSISIYEAAGAGATVLVGEDRFARWLASMCPSIVPVDPLDMSEHLAPSPAGQRLARSETALRAFGWSAIAGEFVGRYRAMQR